MPEAGERLQMRSDIKVLEKLLYRIRGILLCQYTRVYVVGVAAVC